MSTDIDRASDLSIAHDQTRFTDVQTETLLRHMGVEDAPRADLDVFFHRCKMTGLDPFSGQIHMISRNTRQPDGTYAETFTIQTGIDGYRLTARRAANRARHQMSISAPEWCDENGTWRPVWSHRRWGYPLAARVTVTRDGQAYTAVANFDEYVQTRSGGQPNRMWATMPAGQIGKCFDSETEVLTEHGFMRFAEVDGQRIMQVTPEGLEPVHAAPFEQDYDGPMIGGHGDMLDYSVTPNHDMVTTAGKVEASEMLATSLGPNTARCAWRIPFTHDGVREDNPLMTDDDLRRAAAIVSDGWSVGGKFKVSVSRPHKVAALAELAPSARSVRRAAGDIAVTATRTVRTNYDKAVFTFDADSVAAVLDTDKRIDVSAMLSLSPRQIRVFVDTWIAFDGSTNKKTGVRRLYTSRRDHLRAAETLAIAAGYSVNVPRSRTSDISERVNWYMTISEPRPQPVRRAGGARNSPGIAVEAPPADKKVWCVTVPSGVIVVRRRGFSFLCGNCAEALALRKAFPQDLSDLYVAEEMEQADNAAPVPNPRPELNEARPRLDVSAPVEGVVVAPEGAPPPSAPDPSRTDSLAGLFQLMAEAGPSGKAAKIEYMSRVIGREISGSGDLTDDEITAVMDALHVDRAAAAEDADGSGEDQ